MWIVACALTLAAASTVPPDSTSQIDPSSYPSLEALRRYASGRLYEEDGAYAEALAEDYHALLADPRSTALMDRAGELNIRIREPARALELADRALAVDPDDARSHWLRGAALFHLERYPDALAALQRATALAPGESEFQRTLAHAAEQVERWDVVAGAWRQVVQVEDEDAEAWFQLGAAEGRLSHFAAADSALAEAEDLNPDRPGLDFMRGLVDQSLGRTDSAIDRLGRHLREHPEDAPTRRRLVELLAQARRWDQAYALSRQVAGDSPDDPEALEVEADLAYHAGRATEGRAVIDRMIKAAPDDPASVARAGALLSRNGRAREGARLAETWAAAHPGDPRGEDLAARARAQSNDWDLAIGHARRAAAAQPDSIDACSLVARIQQSAKRWTAAESSWAEVIRRFPGDAPSLLELGFCREQGGNLDGAESAVREVLAHEPDNPIALNFLGYMFADHGMRLEEALHMIQRAVELEPGNGAFVDSFGWVLYRLGRLADARTQLERAQQLTGGDPEVHEHLGDVYKDMRLMDLAREQYRLALAGDPANPRVKTKLAGLR